MRLIITPTSLVVVMCQRSKIGESTLPWVENCAKESGIIIMESPWDPSGGTHTLMLGTGSGRQLLPGKPKAPCLQPIPEQYLPSPKAKRWVGTPTAHTWTGFIFDISHSRLSLKFFNSALCLESEGGSEKWGKKTTYGSFFKLYLLDKSG